MWRDLFDSSRNRGRGGEDGARGASAQAVVRGSRAGRLGDAAQDPERRPVESGPVEEEQRVKPSPTGAEDVRDALSASDVSRETWLPPAEEAWQEPTAADT